MNTNLTSPLEGNGVAASPDVPIRPETMAETMAETEINPDRLLQLGLGFWASKVLLAAVELGVFTELGKRPQTADEIRVNLGLHPRGTLDLLDALVSLGVLERNHGVYSNTPESGVFLDRARPTYVGGILEMANTRLYPSWGRLGEAVRTGNPQNEVRNDTDTFAALYADPVRLREFLSAMTGISMGSARALAKVFPWQKYRTFLDVGAAQGCLPVQLALAHPHLQGANFDLPPVGPVFEEYVRGFGLQDRLRFVPGDFFRDEFPTAQVIVMGHILHDWNLEEKRSLIAKAYRALPNGGAFIVHESIIDDERRRNSFGLLMSLNMLIETKGGFDFTGADCARWMRETGFKETRVEHLCGPDSMVVGFKG